MRRFHLDDRTRGMMANAPLGVHAAISDVAHERLGVESCGPLELERDRVRVNGKCVNVRFDTVSDDRSVGDTAEEAAVVFAIYRVSEMVAKGGVAALLPYSRSVHGTDVTLKAMFRGVAPMPVDAHSRVARALGRIWALAAGR